MRLTVVLLSFAAIIGCSGKDKKADAPATPAAAPAAAAAQSTAPAPAADAAKAKTSIVCKRADEVRTLHIDQVQPKGCKLFYSNHSASEPVASSAHGTAHCDQISANIQENITKIGFKCETAAKPN